MVHFVDLNVCSFTKDLALEFCKEGKRDICLIQLLTKRLQVYFDWHPTMFHKQYITFYVNFVWGAGRLWQVLVWPLLCSAVLIVGFAQMFYSLLYATSVEQCPVALGGRALCTVPEAITIVYLLLMGVPLDTADPEGEALSGGAIALIAFFTLFFFFSW
jgi:hypothetical protein